MRTAKRHRYRKKRGPLRRIAKGVLAVLCLALLALGVYLWYSTKNDFLWLELEQLPHRDATILYAQDRASGEWTIYARLEATQIGRAHV